MAAILSPRCLVALVVLATLGGAYCLAQQPPVRPNAGRDLLAAEIDRLQRELEAIDAGSLPRADLGRVLRDLAECLRQAGRFSESLAAGQRYDAFLTRLSNSPTASRARRENALLLAHDCLALARYDDALTHLALVDRLGTARVAWIDFEAAQAAADAWQCKGAEEQAARAWRQVADVARLLVATRNALDLEQHAECAETLTVALARSDAAPNELDAARTASIAALQQLGRAQARVGDAAGVTETAFRVAAQLERAGDVARADAMLARAAEAGRNGPMARFWQGVALGRRSALARSTGDDRNAARFAQDAIAAFEDYVRANDADGTKGPHVLDSLEALADLYEREADYDEAIRVCLRLHDERQRKQGEDHVATQEVAARLGTLYGLTRRFDRAGPLLRQALTYWRQRAGAAPERLAAALNDLAAVERANGSLTSALALIDEAIELREASLPPTDLRLAYAHNNRASILAALGRYTASLRDYERALEICTQAENRSDAGAIAGLRRSILFNIAMNYASQGQAEKGIAFCRQALDDADVDQERSLEAAGRHVVLARLYRRVGDAESSVRHAERAWDVCEELGEQASAEAAAAASQLGAHALQDQATWPEARQYLERARATYASLGRADLAGRTQNTLGVLAYAAGDRTEARTRLEAALAAYRTIEVRPQDHYSALCNLALVEDEAGNRTEARSLLEDAVRLTELPRTETSLAEWERADFLYRFADAFDLLVAWSVEAGDFDAAVLTAERSRSRTFLDQLQLAGIDIREELRGGAPAERALLEREASLRARLHSMLAQVRRSASEPDAEMAAELERLRRDYREAWSAIRGASETYRSLRRQGSELASIDRLRDDALGSGDLLLLYHLGDEQGYVFLIDPLAPTRCYPLTLDGRAIRLLEEANAAAPASLVVDATRGLVGTAATQKGDREAGRNDEPRAVAGVPLTRGIATGLVTYYRGLLQDPQASTSRGLVGRAVTEKGVRDEPTATALGDLLLPTALRARLADREPEHLVISPDGALHSLPFEALLVSTHSGPQYALDALPPIAYVPSGNSLLALRDRVEREEPAAASVLTVGNPAYRARGELPPGSLAVRASDAFLAFGAPLVPLPATEGECRRIEQTFGSHRTTLLVGTAATEGNTVEAMAGKRYVHLAAHGFANAAHDNLFGAIALTPPQSEAAVAREDGFLHLAEIHGLPLVGCDLAVLSACQTSVGPQRKLEAASSLAQAFLCAGSKRVLATQWSVADRSTATLIGEFFERVAAAEHDPNGVSYAQALREARRAVRREHPEWSAPFYWAPFVLHGPPR